MTHSMQLKIFFIAICLAMSLVCEGGEEDVNECGLFFLCDCDETSFEFFDDCYNMMQQKSKDMMMDTFCEKTPNSTNLEDIVSVMCSMDRKAASDCMTEMNKKHKEYMMSLSTSFNKEDKVEHAAIVQTLGCLNHAITMCNTFPGECMM